MKIKFVLIPILIIVMMLLYAEIGISQSPDPTGSDSINVASNVPLLLQYQGRLTDPTSGSPVSDGVYTITFRLYAVPVDGTALWTEIRAINVTGGLISTVLGDLTPLAHSLFNGQALWLGVKVGTDEEALPRQQILPAAYAMSLVPGALIQTNSNSSALQVTNQGSGNALSITGLTTLNGNLTVTGSLTGGSHTHSGADINSGVVTDARIDTAIARDSEIMPAVLSYDGPCSVLNADLLDGSHA